MTDQNDSSYGPYLARMSCRCMPMPLYKCPNCNHPGGEFDVFPSKEKFRWYEISQKRTSCRHCGAEVALEERFQRWGLLAIPAIVIFVWDLSMASQGGVNDVLKYFSLGLAVLGTAVLYGKRKLVVVKPPFNRSVQPNTAKPRR